MAIQLGGAMEAALLGGAGAVALLSAVTKGPLGALRVLPRGLHRALDVVIGAGLALSPLTSLAHVDVLGTLIAEGAAVLMLRLAFITRYRPSRPPAARRAAGPVAGTAGTAGATAAGTAGATAAVPGGPAGDPHSSSPLMPGPTGGRPGALTGPALAMGRLTGRARRQAAGAGSSLDRALGAGARQLGGELGRRAARRNRP